MKINHIAIVSIPVSNQQVSKDFYKDILGFEVIRDNPMGPNQQWIELAPKGAKTSITLVTWFENMSPGVVQGVVIDTNDIKMTHEELRGRGLDISEIDEAPWGKFATFSDPDGNGWVIQQAA